MVLHDGPGVYLLHFLEPIPRGEGKELQHYLGVSVNVAKRIEQHRLGTSRARVPQVMKERNISFVPSRLWPCENKKEAYLLERKLKRQKNGKRLCHLCVATGKEQNGNS